MMPAIVAVPHGTAPVIEPWSEIDAWRSIWEALAIVNGDDPDVAVEGHRRMCRRMGWEPADAPAEPA